MNRKYTVYSETMIQQIGGKPNVCPHQGVVCSDICFCSPRRQRVVIRVTVAFLSAAYVWTVGWLLSYSLCFATELEEQIRKHYEQTGEVLHSSRLHILLPLSAVAPAKMEEADNNVRFHKNLPELQLDRAGVRRRVYKHSIYKITDHKQEVRS